MNMRSTRPRRATLVALILTLMATACGGGSEVETTDCGQDNQTGPRREWNDLASRCFRAGYQEDVPVFARVVETREGVGLATVEYEADGSSDTYTRRVIRSGGATTVSECTRLGATTVDDKVQLDPLDCEPLGG